MEPLQQYFIQSTLAEKHCPDANPTRCLNWTPKSLNCLKKLTCLCLSNLIQTFYLISSLLVLVYAWKSKCIIQGWRTRPSVEWNDSVSAVAGLVQRNEEPELIAFALVFTGWLWTEENQPVFISYSLVRFPNDSYEPHSDPKDSH